jgi:hypothetical protein
VAGKIYKAGMSLLVIDTENKFVSTGFAKEIARVAQGMFGMSTPPISYGAFSFFLKISNTIFTPLNFEGKL